MTEDEMQAKRAKQAAVQRAWRERHADELANLTPEQREAKRAYQREYMNKRNAAMTPEERAAFNERTREYARERRANETPEQREKRLAYAREAQARRKAANPDAVREANRRYTARRKEKDDYPGYRAARLETGKRFSAALRMTALIRYSGDPPHCVCCGDQHIEFLAIDHIGGGGGAHRKALKGASINLWLRNNGYPDGFRVLCHNCNWAVQFGPCPHEREKIIPLTRPQGGCS